MPLSVPPLSLRLKLRRQALDVIFAIRLQWMWNFVCALMPVTLVAAQYTLVNSVQICMEPSCAHHATSEYGGTDAFRVKRLASETFKLRVLIVLTVMALIHALVGVITVGNEAQTWSPGSAHTARRLAPNKCLFVLPAQACMEAQCVRHATDAPGAGIAFCAGWLEPERWNLTDASARNATISMRRTSL